MIATLRRDDDLIGPLADEVEVVAERLASWRPEYSPRNDREEWLFTQVVVQSVRIDRCHAHTASLRTRQARRAAVAWDEDRRLAAETLARSLRKKSSLTVSKLRCSLHGCEVLLDRWKALGAALENHEGWDEERVALVHDLLGHPPELRDPCLIPKDRAGLVREQIARLEEARATLTPIDAMEKRMAVEGMGETSADLKTVRRYEAQCYRRFDWAAKELRKNRQGSAPTEPTLVKAPRFGPDSEYEAMSEEEYYERDAELFRALLGPAAPPPSPAPAPKPVPPTRAAAPAPAPRPLNCRQRRAAQRHGK